MSDLQVVLPNYAQLEKIDQNMTMIKSSKNLFNADTITALADPAWCYSTYINVVAGKSYKLNKFHTSASAGVKFFNETKTYVSMVVGSDVTNNGRVVTVPSGCCFVTITMKTVDAPTTQFELGTVSTDFEAYKTNNLMKQLSNMLDNKTAITVRQEGTETELDGYDGYEQVASVSGLEFYKNTDTAKKIWAAINMYGTNIAVMFDPALVNISFSVTGVDGEYDKTVKFNSTNFPNLKSYSTVEHILMLQGGTLWRCVIITTAGQIYHNFPKRGTGTSRGSVDGDMLLWEESVVWDMPGRKYPSNVQTADANYSYMPGLPSAGYDFYPMLNTDASFVDTYGNGGFADTLTVGTTDYCRYYEPNRNPYYHSFTFMGGFEIDTKLALIGTYKSNMTFTDRSRICVFASDDAGRTWFNKYEFTSQDAIPNWGYAIDTSDSTQIPSDYPADRFTFTKRTLSIPSGSVKEPSKIYTLGTPILVTGITRASASVVTTTTAHGLTSGDVIVFNTTGDATPFDFLLNPTASDQVGGNGIFWKIEKLTATTFKIRQFIHNPFTNLPARHIHSINKIKDGYIIGTGEIYPNGWIVFLRLAEGETALSPAASSDFDFYRLTSSYYAIQRTLGTFLIDDADGTVIFAADHATLPRSNVAVDGRTDLTFARNSLGVFKGKLANIDDFSSFECIMETREPAYFFKNINGYWIFGGQRGGICVSNDGGLTWQSAVLPRLPKPIQHFYGTTRHEIILDDFIVKIEKT